MHIEEIYTAVLSKWPAVISIKDGIMVGDSGVLSKELTNVWNKAAANVSNEWEDVGVWVYYGLLHKMVPEAFLSSQHTINANSVTLDAFAAKYPDALLNNGDDEMVATFAKMNVGMV